MRVFLLIFAALIVAAGTGFYAWQGLRPKEAPVAQAVVEAPKPTEVFVARSELTVGTIILPDQLARMPIERSAITPEMVEADAAGEQLLVGSVARQVLPKGVPIARSATVQPGDRGFLAAVLPEGMRAISIPISEVGGISGLVMPGDRVDIILTYSVAADTIDAKRDVHASETVVTNLRVLALDQRLQKSGPDAIPGSKDGPPVASTATIEVTPQQAETITLATTLGELSLVLNSVRDGGDPKPEPEAGTDAVPTAPLTPVKLRDTGGRMLAIRPRNLTLDSDVTSLLQQKAEAKALTQVQVVRGHTSKNVELGGAVAGTGAVADAGQAAAAVPSSAPQK